MESQVCSSSLWALRITHTLHRALVSISLWVRRLPSNWRSDPWCSCLHINFNLRLHDVHSYPLAPTVHLHGEVKAGATSKGIFKVLNSLSHSEVRWSCIFLVIDADCLCIDCCHCICQYPSIVIYILQVLFALFVILFKFSHQSLRPSSSSSSSHSTSSSRQRRHGDIWY